MKQRHFLLDSILDGQYPDSDNDEPMKNKITGSKNTKICAYECLLELEYEYMHKEFKNKTIS